MNQLQFLFGAFTDVIKGFLSAFKNQPRIDNSWKREGIKATTVKPAYKVEVIGPRHKERLDFFQRQNGGKWNYATLDNGRQVAFTEAVFSDVKHHKDAIYYRAKEWRIPSEKEIEKAFSVKLETEPIIPPWTKETKQPRPNGHNTQRPSGYTCSKCDGVFDRLRIAEHLKGCN